MTKNNFSSRQIAGLIVALLWHAVLLRALLQAPARHPQLAEETLSGKPISWLRMTPPAPPPAIRQQLAQKPRPPEKDIVKKSVPEFAIAAAVPASASITDAPALPGSAPPQVSAEEMLRLAKLDLAKIDRELRKEGAGGPAGRISGGVESQAQRLARGFDEAHAAAPQKWYQAARVEDITPPGDDARKIYRITTALGTYCVRYPDKNKMPQTGAANFGAPLVGACPHMF
jgi:hypothetical protein